MSSKKYAVERKKVRRTGMGQLNRREGWGFPKEKATITYETWCVRVDGKLVAECRSKMQAARVAMALELVEESNR